MNLDSFVSLGSGLLSVSVSIRFGWLRVNVLLLVNQLLTRAIYSQQLFRNSFVTPVPLTVSGLACESAGAIRRLTFNLKRLFYGVADRPKRVNERRLKT